MKYNITKMIIENWGIDRYKELSMHYKIYLRNNYKNTLIRRYKRELSNKGN
jgi:hypothetical protein